MSKKQDNGLVDEAPPSFFVLFAPPPPTPPRDVIIIPHIPPSSSTPAVAPVVRPILIPPSPHPSKTKGGNAKPPARPPVATVLLPPSPLPTIRQYTPLVTPSNSTVISLAGERAWFYVSFNSAAHTRILGCLLLPTILIVYALLIRHATRKRSKQNEQFRFPQEISVRKVQTNLGIELTQEKQATKPRRLSLLQWRRRRRQQKTEDPHNDDWFEAWEPSVMGISGPTTLLPSTAMLPSSSTVFSYLNESLTGMITDDAINARNLLGLDAPSDEEDNDHSDPFSVESFFEGFTWGDGDEKAAPESARRPQRQINELL